MAESGQRSPATLTTDASPDLAALREQVDAIDRAILEQLNARSRLVQAIGGLKAASGSAVYEAARERQIVEQLAARNPGPFPNAGIAPRVKRLRRAG
jgi:chorismate mutase